MSLQTWEEALVTAQVAGGTLSNSTTPTSILPTQALYTFPSSYFSIGKMLRVTSIGQVSNVVTTPGTLTLDFRLAATIFAGSAVQMTTTAHTTLPYWWECVLTCRAVGSGSATNFMGQARIMGQMFCNTSGADAATGHGVVLTPNTAPAVGTGVDGTATQKIDHFATFSVVTSPTNITLQQFVLESLN